MSQRFVISLFIVCFWFGQTTTLEAQENQESDSISKPNDWNFRISPYFWFVGLKGTIYRPPQPELMPEPPPPKYDIDVGFKDIKNSIKFALMLAGQYKTEHIITQFNFSSLILESEAITPYELVLQDNIIKLTYMAGDIGVGYRVVKNPKFEFDALLGAKFIYFKIGLKTNAIGIGQIEGERSQYWIDPVIGTNLRYRPHPKIELIGYGDIGPTVFNTYNTSQFMLGANYMFTKTFMVSFGYRSYHLDFPRKEAIFNGNVKGWIMKVGFQF
ncbi:hypothetical protein [Algibacter mikhailovii]|uniref:hypothetical protein n=1 Tax=Algibacter mikhailovii TaxID=425498 RepID=UPI002494650B|nr:hypothetical protein [Algibacter mikhailovii]